METLAEGEAGMKDLRDGSKFYNGDADTLKNIAIVFTLSSKPNWSIEYLERAIELKPEMAEAHYALGALSGKAGQLEKGFKHLEQAVKLNPKYQQAYFALGSMQLEQGKSEAAVENLKKATELNPEDAAALRNLGMSLFTTKQYQAAISASYQSLELEPSHVESRVIIGRSFTALGKRSEAETALLKAIEIAPESADAYLYLGNELLEQERGLEATKAYQKFLDLMPKSHPGFFGLARAAKLEGQHEKAIEHLKKAVELDPDEMQKIHLLGDWLNTAKRYDEAIELFRAAIEANPNETASFIGLAISLRYSGQLAASIEALRKALALDPNYAGGYVTLGEMFAELSESDAEPMAAFNDALKLNPKNAQAYLGMGIYLLKTDKIAEATESLKKATQFAPNTKEAWIALAAAHQTKGSFEDAWTSVAKANELDGDAHTYARETKILRAQLDLETSILDRMKAALQTGKALDPKSFDDDLTRIHSPAPTKFRNAQLREYWEAHRDSLAKEFEHAVVQSITIPKKVDATKKDSLPPLKLAEAIRQQALEGKDFAKLAKKYSQDTTAETGGRREFDYGSFLPTLRDAVFSLQPNEVSPVLDFEDSYYLFKMIERQSADPKSIKSDDPKVQAIVSAILEKEKQQRWKEKYFQACLERLKASAK